MKRLERQRWIVEWLNLQKQNSSTGFATADIFNSNFVWDYINATGVAMVPQPFGAPKCFHLGNDLADLYRRGVLIRNAVGLSGLCGQGFPRWVYVYELNETEN